MPRSTLDPKLDIVFKLLLEEPRNKQLLIALLTDALWPSVPIVDVTVLNPITRHAHVSSKGATVDVHARLGDGRLILIEIQIRRHTHFVSRGLFYWARVYSGQLTRGHEYGSLRPTIGVYILDFDEFPDDRFHRTFELLDTMNQERLSDALTLHFFELKKLRKRAPDAAVDPMLRWGQFLAAQTDEELEALSMTDPTMKQAKEALEELSADHWAREWALKREWELASYEQELAEEKAKAAEEGRAAGHAEGRAAGHAEGRAAGHAEGHTTGLAEGRVEGLAEGLVEGRRSVLEKLLRIKFGDEADEWVARLARAGEEDLDLWIDRAVTAQSPDEVFR